MAIAKEYALYNRDEFIAVGTIKEISEETGLKIDTLYYYKTSLYKKRLAARKKQNRGRERILILLEDEE